MVSLLCRKGCESKEVAMLRALVLIVVGVSASLGARGHPGSGIAVDEKGRVYFTDSLKGVWCVEEGGKLTLVNKSAMHWMAIDPEGTFAQAPEEFGEWFGRLTPKGRRPTLISCSDFPCVVGKDGNLYYAHMHSLKIMRRTPQGKE